MSKEIIICSRCKGQGIVSCSELVDYHKGDYDEWTEKCQECNGSGRILKTTTVKYEQYKPSKAKPRDKT